MPSRTKPTRELIERIVANYRQTGDLTNAAIRSGISRSTVANNISGLGSTYRAYRASPSGKT